MRYLIIIVAYLIAAPALAERSNPLVRLAAGQPLTLEAQDVIPRCVANGTVDCLSAFNAAIDSLPYSNGTANSGGTIQLGSGVYYVSGSVNMTGKHGLTIIGQTSLASSVTTNGGSYPIFVAAASYAAPTNKIEVKDINLICGGQANTEADGIKWAYVNNGKIDGNLFFGCHHAVDLTGQYLTYFTSNNVTGRGSQQNGTCLYMGFPTDQADTYGNNAIVASHNLCQFASGDAARIVDGNGSLFDHNQWLGPGGMGIHACDQPAASYPSGSPAQCEFMFFGQDQTDTTGSYGWQFKRGAGGEVGPGIVMLQPWAGSTVTAAFDIEDASDVQIDDAEIETTDIGFKLVNLQSSRLSGKIFKYNARNNGSQSILLSGTSPGSQGNYINISAFTDHPVTPSYNGIVETGKYANNSLYAGIADCASSIGLRFGGGSTGLADASGRNGCLYEVKGLSVRLQVHLGLPAAGSGVGVATLTGLPLVVRSASPSGDGGISMLIGEGMAGLAGPIIVQAVPATTSANLLSQGPTGTRPLSDTNFTKAATLTGALEYFKQ